jgi:CRP-like cAMP-binding protein
MSARRASPHLTLDRMRRLGLFREFTPPEMSRIRAIGNVQTYGDGEFLATEGTRKQRRVLYVVLAGELQYVKRVRAQHANVVLTLRPGDVGGFLTFLNEDPSPVSVRSRRRTTVFEIGRRELQGLAETHPSLAFRLLLVLLGDTARRIDALLLQAAATSAWALDLERHLRTLPLLGGEAEAR